VDDLVARASRYAISAHARVNHLRKYTLQPYDVHLSSVARLVEEAGGDPAMVAAAWLHDVVEDTPATFDDIEREFGTDVAILVRELTDVSTPGDGNRAARKAIDRGHFAAASARGKSVKLADVIDNCEDICRHDPGFGRIYLAELRTLLEVLKEGDAALYARAAAKVAECSERLARGPAGGGKDPPVRS
jgi:(p)ppGpp synthase/HD superfamily hydrolase